MSRFRLFSANETVFGIFFLSDFAISTLCVLGFISSAQGMQKILTAVLGVLMKIISFVKDGIGSALCWIIVVAIAVVLILMLMPLDAGFVCFQSYSLSFNATRWFQWNHRLTYCLCGARSQYGTDANFCTTAISTQVPPHTSSKPFHKVWQLTLKNNHKA